MIAYDVWGLGVGVGTGVLWPPLANEAVTHFRHRRFYLVAQDVKVGKVWEKTTLFKKSQLYLDNIWLQVAVHMTLDYVHFRELLPKFVELVLHIWAFPLFCGGRSVQSLCILGCAGL